MSVNFAATAIMIPHCTLQLIFVQHDALHLWVLQSILLKYCMQSRRPGVSFVRCVVWYFSVHKPFVHVTVKSIAEECSHGGSTSLPPLESCCPASQFEKPPAATSGPNFSFILLQHLYSPPAPYFHPAHNFGFLCKVISLILPLPT